MSMPLKANDPGSRMDSSSPSWSVRARISALDHPLRTVASTPLYQVELTAAPGKAVPTVPASTGWLTNMPSAGGELGVISPSGLGILGNMNDSASFCQKGSSGSVGAIRPAILADTLTGES